MDILEIAITIFAGLIIGILGKFFAPGDKDNIPIWLTIVCGIGGVVIGLSATPLAAVKVPATITIPAGASSANFNVVASSVAASTPAHQTPSPN